ncbi:ATP-dependent DNA ligase [Bacillus subtilis]|uniref:ATP-dependent DNA ligase n=1 Tax=Bacillus subtilis TaxID=1423 RepID=UPI003F7CC4DC
MPIMICSLWRGVANMLNQLIKPMLLYPLQPDQIKSWKYNSLKWDGFRILIHYENGKVRAFSRHGTEVTLRFPELLNIKLSVKSAILDGECIAFDLTQPKDQPPKYWWDDAMVRFNTKTESGVKRIVTTSGPSSRSIMQLKHNCCCTLCYSKVIFLRRSFSFAY